MFIFNWSRYYLSHISLPYPWEELVIIFIIQYFRSSAISSVSLYFPGSPFMLFLHLCFGRPLLRLPETSSISDFAQMWLGSRLKQWLNHFSLQFPWKFQHVLYARPAWCHPYRCGPTLSSLLPISTSSFRLRWVCSHISFFPAHRWEQCVIHFI